MDSLFVGASIARPLLPEGQFGLTMQIIVFAGARPAAAGELSALRTAVIAFTVSRPVITAMVVFAHAL